jgi:cell division protein FtsN
VKQIIGIVALAVAGVRAGAQCPQVPAAAEQLSRGKVVVVTTEGGDVVTAASQRQWTVQIATYETLAEAEGLQRTLCQRGYAARVVGMSRPYSVQVGWYPSAASALAVARALRPDHHAVFVTGATRASGE